MLKILNFVLYAENVIYGLAIDYYDEPEGTYNEKMNQTCEVIVGKEVELTPEEIKEVKEKAKKRLEQEQYEAMKKLPGQKKQDKVSVITVVLNQNYYRYIPDTKELKKNGTLVLKQDYNEQDKIASMLAYAEWKYGTNTEYKNLMQKNILDLRAHGNCFNEEKPYLDRTEKRLLTEEEYKEITQKRETGKEVKEEEKPVAVQMSLF